MSVSDINTHHIHRIRTGNRKQVLLMESCGKGLRLQCTRILQLLHRWKLSLLTVCIRYCKI